MAPSSARRRGTFGAFRRPLLTDPVFWIAAAMSVAIGLVASAAIVGLGGKVPDSALGWSVAIVVFAIAGWLSFKLLAMGLNTSRALEEADVADPTRAASLEGKGRAAGAVVGRGAAALRKRGRKKTAAGASAAPVAPAPSPSAPPTPQPATAAGAGADDATPDVSVDNAARVLGSMVGRRLADRRKNES